jgi:ectoine hydroxylase-related dioxygenase (phytanoyl-CoA dioxygenase family)
MAPASSPTRCSGPHYAVTPDERERFFRDGFVHLEGVLGDDELAVIERDYDRFLRREIVVPGKDLCDMSGDYSRTFEQYSIVNVMLPRRYYPAWVGNLYEQRAASIVEQLHGAGMQIDYDQLLAKRPFKDDAVFEWHQDQAYWPVFEDSRTATCWLAIDDSTLENGCMRFVPGSHTAPLRPHRPLRGDRGESHTLCCEVDPARDEIRPMPIRRGDITVHNERVLHGSGGNRTAGWRRAYIVAFRARETIAEERRRGFTHSHNDEREVLDNVGTRETQRERGTTRA